MNRAWGRFFLIFVVIMAEQVVFGMDNTEIKRTIEEPRTRLQPLEPEGFQEYVQEPPEGMDFIAATDAGYEYTGRIDFKNPEKPVLIWQGTQVRFTFRGTRLAVRMSRSNGNSWYNVIIDGKIYLLHLRTGHDIDYLLAKNLDEGMHSCTLFKRVEGYFAQDVFCGVMLDRGETLGAKPQPRPLKIEFYGDSITAGACNEVPGDDNYDDYSQHNNYTSYAALTARMLNAEYSNIAISGTGVCVSWNEMILAQTWQNLYARLRSPKYRFDGRVPDIVVINLGQNDYGYPESRGESFPADFQENYEVLLQEMRSQYPDAWLVCATGGMGAVKSCRALNSGIARAIKNLDDDKIIGMTFRAFTYNHPRVDTHEKMADELTRFIQENIIPLL